MQLVQKQVKLGLMDEDSLTDNFKTREIGFISVITDNNFIVEVLMLAMIPYPI
jgi:hypothetical protein